MKAIAAVHVGLKQLGIDDETGRDLYERVTGKRSLAAMTELEINRIVQELRDKGFKPASNGTRKPLKGRFAKKLQALWIAAWNLGIVKSNDDAALITFVKRQTKIDHVQFLQDADDASKAIEALKNWMMREAGVAWASGRFEPDFARAHGFKITWAQWLRLGGSVHANDTHLFWGKISVTLDRPCTSINPPNDAEWQKVMNAFGREVRDRMAAGGL
nr:MAG TPA: Protein of unknown function (DUF1018) [Caudoviricetes sp.]